MSEPRYEVLVNDGLRRNRDQRLPDGSPIISWRGVPILPTDKIPVTGGPAGTTSILLLRVGEAEQGVIGLRPAKVDDEAEPGLTVRRMSVDQHGITSHLVTSYFSTAVLVEDAIAMLEDVEVPRRVTLEIVPRPDEPL